MAAPSSTTRPPRPRPVFRNVNITDLMRYRQPVPAIVSILHRVSGALLFLFLWLVLWLLQTSVTDVARFQSLYSNLLVKLIVLVLLWSLMHHLCAGIRYLVMDVSHKAVELKPGRQSGAVVLVVSILLTVLVGVRIW